MGLLDGLFDKREKKSYSDAMRFFFDITQLQRVQYTEQFEDINEEEYRSIIVGIVASYLDTKPKQKKTIFSCGEDLIFLRGLGASKDFKENLQPKYKEAYKKYNAVVKNKMNNTINATNAKLLAYEICDTFNIEIDAARINAISIDICTMIDIIDATFDTFRFV